MLSPATPWQPSSPRAGKCALTLFSIESSTPSLLPAFRCGPMPASQPDFPSPTQHALDLIGSHVSFSSFHRRAPVLIVSSQCQPCSRRRQPQRVRVWTVPCDGFKLRLPPGFNLLDAFMHT